MKKILFLVVSICLLILSGRAQDRYNAISVTYIQGLRVSSTFNTHLDGNYNGGQVGYHIVIDSTEWAKRLSVKDIEIQASYLNYQNVAFAGINGSRGVLGNHYSLTAGVNIHVAKWGAVTFMISPGIGAAYAPKNFYTTNNENFAIGSALNVLLYARAKIVVPVFPSIYFEGGAGISHTSNGSLSFPNNGIDNISGFAGVLVDLKKVEPVVHKTTFVDDENFFSVTGMIGGRSQEKTGYTKNPKTNTGYFADTAIQTQTPLIYQANLLLGYTHHVSTLFSVSASTDAAYYFKNFSWNNFFKTYEGAFTSTGHFSLGITAGADLWAGRMVFSVGGGYYVFHQFLYPSTHFYIPWGVKYFLSQQIALHIRTVSNDYSSLGVTIAFKNKN
jgi:hypothetical protein